MAASRRPSPDGSHAVSVQDGTLCRAESPKPGPIGTDQFGAHTKQRVRVLGLDGAKVHDFLFHVALAELQWLDLSANARAAVDSIIPKDRALERASMLYDEFLEACSKGPNQATAFLAQQHNLQKKYLQKSQAILQSLQQQNAHDQILLSEVAFGAQAVKSLATAGVAIIGLFLAAPEIVAGAGIAFGYDVGLEIIKRLGPSNESNADTVVVGFKQTAANDAVNLAGGMKQVSLDKTEKILQKTLNYPQKSSIYRSMVTEGARIDILLKSLGVISAGVTLYTEWNDSEASLKQMQRVRNSY
jgi:hypothetical protein